MTEHPDPMAHAPSTNGNGAPSIHNSAVDQKRPNRPLQLDPVLDARSSNELERITPDRPGELRLDRRKATTPDGPAPSSRRKTSRKTISLVIPARNEAHNLAWVLERIPECVDDVVLVDGSSTDATSAMAKFCYPAIRIVGQNSPGKGEGLRAGFAAAKGDIVVMIDADGSMDPREIPHYIWYLEHGYDFVKGSRFIAGGGSLDITPLRRTGNRALMALVNSRFDTHFTDLCYGFCAFHRSWLPILGLAATGFEIETEMTLQAVTAGLRVTEVPSMELPRRSGSSALHVVRDGWRVLKTIIHTPRHRTVAVGGIHHLDLTDAGAIDAHSTGPLTAEAGQ